MAIHAKHFLPRSESIKARSIYTLQRYELGLLIRLVTGHLSLNAHRHRVNNDVFEQCRLCGQDEETFWHLLHCQELRQEQANILLTSFQARGQWDIRELFQFYRTPRVRALFAPTQWTLGSDVPEEDTSSQGEVLDTQEEDAD